MPLPGKNSENRRQSQTCLSYAEVHPVLRKAKNTGSSNLKNLHPSSSPLGETERGAPFFCFCLHKIGDEGATALVARQAGRLRTSRIDAKDVLVSGQETLS